MTAYTCAGVATIWLRNGGAHGALVNAVAVSTAESGRNDTAISSSNDYGLWQINGIHFATFGVDRHTVLNPDTNARIAIALSGNGANWAPWCTCWQDPGPNCGHGYLPNPQPGSAAYAQIPGVIAQIGGAGQGVGSGIGQGVGNPAAGAWGTLQTFLGPWAKGQYASMVDNRTAIERLFR